ncbi:MAG: tRNA preQ1(34) S-adenosylmethionine ribosyltransferase-isomerase QueA [Kordiimonadaceae bacterium]|nr:tRNA preQ1(34) S-adenosylmethionine ribosyltransferase-isomerase QueA [Kordiimonadaceae bacterium]MBO6570243.1 tRNA preQ1(34) S-adenosylmethionine ribosyltransferase-isomerase QueA [Kordiimonadaceae bacterium]MBO6965659.1 tRNA preQ1(34) S-adenosylmethionine ribosyltransferase-isomerase QueA [Kordiimonadaceae bacterium]
MDIELFDFQLPNEQIALRPVSPRDSARMLLVDGDAIDDAHVSDLPQLLLPGDVLVFNDTRVIPGRLTGKRGEAKIQVTLHKRVTDIVWRVFAKPAKKARLGDVIDFDGLEAEVIAVGEDGERTLAFKLENDAMSAALESHGVMPLPPYIAAQRAVDEADKADYQTVYAENDGAVAAPTAGLHFTPELLERLRSKGVHFAHVTLHVGAGTFLPVKVQNTDDHKMHSEWGEISQETASLLNQVRENGGRIVSVGTTSLRLLESAATEKGTVEPFSGDTDIFITPGYRFKAVDMLMTNFHLPKSTLFMLVSALAGMKEMRAAYNYAIEHGYRFYSYGDSSLLTMKRDNS